MAQKEKRQYNLSPRNTSEVSALKRKLDEYDFMEGTWDAQMQEVQRRMKNQGKMMAALQKQVNTNTNESHTLNKGLLHLQGLYIENLESTTGQFQKLQDNCAKLTRVQQDCLRRLSHLGKGSVASGRDRNIPTNGGVQRRKGPCSLCGKELSVKYHREHQQNYCKQAKAAAARPPEAAESS